MSENNYYKNLRPEMQNFITADCKKILDVGCGEGFFSKALKDKYNCEIWGIEPVIAAAEKAAEKSDRVLTGFFSDEIISEINTKFDCIVFNDVLEHMQFPEKALNNARKLLKPDGKIIISVPNIRYYFVLFDLIIGKDWKYKNEGVLDKTHLKFYTKKSFSRFAEENGFKIIESAGINSIDFKTLKLKHRIIYFIFKRYIYDSKYLQFAFVIKPI